MIAEAEITRVKTGADIVAVAANYGLTLQLKGKDHFAKCPFHEDTDASLSVSQAKGVYHCFSCNAKGNVIQLVEKLAGVGFAEAFEIVAGKDLALSRPVVASNNTQTITTPKAAQPTAPMEISFDEGEREGLLKDAFEHMVKALDTVPDGRKYLAARGLVAFEGVEVGYCTADFGAKLGDKIRASLQAVGLLNSRGTPHFADCVVFPLRSVEGKLRGFYGRRTKGSGKHFFLPGRRDGVFAVRRNHEKLIIAESVLDAASLAEKGFADVLALHGVNGWTPAHREFVERFGYKHVYLVLDGDPAGHEAAGRLAMLLRDMGCKTHVVDLPEGEDPNSYLLNADAAKLEWLKNELDSLEAKPSGGLVLSEDAGYLVALGSTLKYTISGLNGQSLEHMKVTLRVQPVNDATRFFIDTVDLYSARHRERVADGASQELNVDVSLITSNIKDFIRLLEEHRIASLSVKEKKVELTEGERAEALASLRSPTLIDDLLRDFEACGAVGEEKGKLLGYVGTVSRLLDKPLGVLIISRSGAGKTTLQESFCDFVPPEDLKQYTRLSKQSLFYGDEDSLKHKVLAVEEEEGASDAKYSIRTLQSGQRLSTCTTRTDPKSGRMVSEEYIVEGPVFIAISTTNPDALDHETRNRFVVMTIDESKQQTADIHRNARQSYTLEGQERRSRRDSVLARCRNMQRLLRPVKVVNSYAPVLQYDTDRLQMRREFTKYMTLIQSIALLHQHQRPMKQASFGEYVEVVPSDIALANDLARTFFLNSVDELAPHTRGFAEVLSQFIKQNGGVATFSRKEVRDYSGWSDWNVRKCLDQLEELEYVRRATGKQGTQVSYEFVADALEDAPKLGALTDPACLDELLAQWNATKGDL